MDHGIVAAAARCAKRGTYGDLAGAVDGAAEQQARDVRARDEEHEQVRHQQHDGHHLDDVVGEVERRAKRHDVDAAIGGLDRMRVGDATGDGVQLALRLGPGHAGSETTDHLQRVTVAGEHGGVQDTRDPDLGRRQWKHEFRRHDADDRVRPAVDLEGAAENVPVASKPCLPEPMAEHHDVALSGSVLAGPEASAQHGLDAEQREDVRRYPS